jgi:mannosyltransferase OCH1-like enzyme
VASRQVLLRHGGVYVDADMECVAPLDWLLHHDGAALGLYTGLSNTGTIEVNNGLIG